MSLSNKRAAVLVAPGFEDSELKEPTQVLKDTGVKVTIIGLIQDHKKGIKGKRGTVVAVDATIDEVNYADFDLLLIPGGKSPAQLRRDQRVLKFVRDFNNEHKPIAAICHGPQVLISAGVLKDKMATSFFTVSRELKESGAKYVSRPVVRDGNLITSRDPRDIPYFTRAILDALE